MKKLLFFALFISINTFAQSVELKPGSNGYVMIPKVSTLGTCAAADKGKIVYYATDNTLKVCNGSAWVAAGSGITLPYIDSGNDVAQVYGLFRLSELSPNSGGSAIQGFSTNGSGIIGSSTNYRGVYGFSSNAIAGYFTSPSGYALITGTGRVGIGIPTPTAQLDVVRGTAPDGTAIFRGTTHVSHFNYATDEHTYIRGGKNGSNVYINDLVGLGFVGIGTNTPQAKLHISQGNLRVDALSGSGNVQMYADNQGTISATIPIGFSAEGTSSPSISNAEETTVPFNQENFDESGFYDNTTYEFNAPVNGIYHFDSSVTFGNVTSVASNATCSMKILVNGSTKAVTTQPMVVSNFQSLNLSHSFKLNAGQKVKITVTQYSGSFVILSAFTGARLFSGHLAIRL